MICEFSAFITIVKLGKVWVREALFVHGGKSTF